MPTKPKSPAPPAESASVDDLALVLSESDRLASELESVLDRLASVESRLDDLEQEAE